MRTAQHETAERVRTISGFVFADGTWRGIGFTSYKASTGVYGLRWLFPAKALIDIAAAAIGGGTGVMALADTTGTPQTATVRTYNAGASVLTDAIFSFKATLLV